MQLFLVGLLMLFNAVFGDDSILENSDWRQFRGPMGSGVFATNKGLPDRLDIEHPSWKIPVPPGHSSPIVVGKRIYLTGYTDGKLETHCLEIDTGKTLWTRELDVDSFEKTHPQHGPASSTPVSDGERVFVVFGSYGVIAYDLEGNMLWKHKLEQHPNLFGQAASPILYNHRLILFWGNEYESILRAIEPSDGATIWERKRTGPASSWSTPRILETAAGPQILFYEPFHLRACSWEGADLWSVPGLADEPITIPQTGAGLVFTTSYNLRTNDEASGLPTFTDLLRECDTNMDQQLDRNEVSLNKSILSRPDADGQGDHPLRMFFRLLDADMNGFITEAEWPRIHTWIDPWRHANGLIAVRPGSGVEPATLAWEHASGVPECPSPIVIESTIYAVRNGGTVTGIRIEDGSRLFQDRLAGGGPYYASPVAGDHKLYLASARGQMTVLDLRQQPPKVLSISQFGEGIFATPALCHAGIIVRSEGHLWRFDQPNP